MDYNSVVSTIVARVEPITPSELLSQMLSHELHLEILQGGHGHQTSTNSAMQGHGRQAGRVVMVMVGVISLVGVGAAPITITTDVSVSCVAGLVMSF
jgi:hypothetical protein